MEFTKELTQLLQTEAKAKYLKVTTLRHEGKQYVVFSFIALNKNSSRNLIYERSPDRLLTYVGLLFDVELGDLCRGSLGEYDEFEVKLL